MASRTVSGFVGFVVLIMCTLINQHDDEYDDDDRYEDGDVYTDMSVYTDVGVYTEIAWFETCFLQRYLRGYPT